MSRRLLGALIVTAWAVFFDYLWASGEALRYVGPRTSWVVPFGAISLTLAAVAALSGAVRAGGVRASGRDAAGSLLTLSPIALVLVLPAASLGAQAASVKDAPDAARSITGRAVARHTPLTLADVAAANVSAEFARKRGVLPGRRIAIKGLVSRMDRGGVLRLTRFTSSCCAADALAFHAPVRLPPAQARKRYPIDQWLAIEGRLAKAPTGGLIIEATQATPIPEPDNPYEAI